MPRLVTKHISSRATHYIRCRPSHRPAVNIFNAVRGGRTCPATGASTRWWTSGWSRSGASSWRGPSPPTAWRGQMPRGHGLEIGAGREREREIERESTSRHVTSRHRGREMYEGGSESYEALPLQLRAGAAHRARLPPDGRPYIIV